MEIIITSDKYESLTFDIGRVFHVSSLITAVQIC